MEKIKSVYIETHQPITKEIKTKLKLLGLKQVKNINQADMFLGNIAAIDMNNFEPTVVSVIGVAKAHALGIPVVVYGYNTDVADARGGELGLVKNEYGLSVVKNTSKTIGKKTEVLGDFLYENIHGNGMLVYNTSIINIYDDSTTLALEVLVAISAVRTKSEMVFDEFKTLAEMNEYINGFYNRSTIYTPSKIEEFRPINTSVIKKTVKDKVYMIGDDVFFISTENGQLVKQRLLSDRVRSMKKEGISAVVPCEMGESTNYNLGVVIEGNNGYAKHSRAFTANLHTMPCEIAAVDAGSLYEIALNLAMGGHGVISVDKNYKDVNGLDAFFKANKNRLAIIINADNDEMSKALVDLEKKLRKPNSKLKN